MNFLKIDLENQRRKLNSDTDSEIIEILIYIICKLESTKDALTSFLPYIEGILIDRPDEIDEVVNISLRGKNNLIACLLRIIETGDLIYDVFVFDMSVRILTRIFAR